MAKGTFASINLATSDLDDWARAERELKNRS